MPFKRRSLLRAAALAPVGLTTFANARAASAGTSPPRITAALIREIEALASRQLATFDVPGAAIALTQDGEVVYTHGFGVRDLKTGEPFTPDTVHRIGSTTKSMTSMLNAIHVDRGLFSFDTPVREITDIFHFPVPSLTHSVTVRQLMGMDTGLGESPIELYLDLESPQHFLRKTLPTLPVLWPPFTKYFYNDFVYACAGYLGLLKDGTPVEDLQDAYARLMERELFGPIGMPTTAVTDNPSNLSDNVARSYGYDLRFSERPAYNVPYQPVRMVSPAGATATTIKEMARYLITQLNGGVTPDGHRIVSSKVLAETKKGQTPVPGTVRASYAMGWITLIDRGVPYTYHTGGVDGFKTDMTIIPQANIGILVFANADIGSYFNSMIRRRVIELLYDLSPSVVELQEQAYAAHKATVLDVKNSATGFSVPRSKIAPYLGNYAKGWCVDYADGLPMMRRATGVSLVLLPTTDAYVIGSDTESGGFGDTVEFVTDSQGARLIISDASGTVDDLPRLER